MGRPKFHENFNVEGKVDETSAELLELYRRGDERAAEAIFHRYVHRLTAMVQWQIGPRMRQRIDPEDAVHSAYRSFFVQARRGEFSLQHSGDLWKLLVTITLNKLRRQIAHHRAAKRSVAQDRPLEAGAAEYAEGPSPLEVLAASDELENFMANLLPEQRRILELRLQDRAWTEIAALVGCSERTARRAIEAIRLVWQRELSFNETSRSTPAVKFEPSVRAKPISIADSLARFDYRDFLLEKHLGSGGMGKVYRAWQKSQQRTVAVKMLRKARWSSPGAVERFLREAEIVAKLDHPGIVGVRGVGRTPGGGLFFVMDFIAGSNLAEFTAKSKPSIRQAVEWITQAATALDHAHRMGIVHCDLKPSNLLRDDSNKIYLSDFGLATTLAVFDGMRAWAGTPGYMAPEQLDTAFGEIGPGTDLFALGLVLLQLLTGKVPFRGKVVLKVLSESKPPRNWFEAYIEENIPNELIDLLADCFSLDPQARLQSALLLAERLERIVLLPHSAS